MLVLVTYDVNITSADGAKRLRKVARECLNYGQRVQNSVFECIVTEAQYTLLKYHLTNIINQQLDSLRFYRLGKNWKNQLEIVGKQTSYDMTSELIV